MCYGNTTTLIHLYIVYGQSQATPAEFSSFGKGHVVPRAKNIDNLALYRSFLKPGWWIKSELHDMIYKASILWPHPLSPGMALATSPLNFIL